ncbi:hypothetical protein PUR49_11355 [Streptomyces sp. BE147]|uniref:hypothetical protein n=1 Tax=Streptomyces sp. BE147 TaxID=3002524 RepID=UPI002E77296C|nr:hypothetical protein [Streptomyces sp. BE147]MEE1737088.1 hypothetical protein [Streptomyces sp. BE147]
MNHNRHNIIPAGSGFPFAGDASSADLASALEVLGALAEELAAPMVAEELRLTQYQRAYSIARWAVVAADSLIEDLRPEGGPGHQRDGSA